MDLPLPDFNTKQLQVLDIVFLSFFDVTPAQTSPKHNTLYLAGSQGQSLVSALTIVPVHTYYKYMTSARAGNGRPEFTVVWSSTYRTVAAHAACVMQELSVWQSTCRCLVMLEPASLGNSTAGWCRKCAMCSHSPLHPYVTLCVTTVM